MSVIFDPDNDHANRQKHGLSLQRADDMNFATAVFTADDRKDYGERRYQAFGLIDGRLHVLIFTIRGEVLRAISLRKANRQEQKCYDQKT